MKCAMEIREIKEQAKIEREIRRMEELAKDIAKFEEIKKNTIEFCETVIAKKIEESATKDLTFLFQEKFADVYVFNFDSSFREEIFIKRLTLDKYKYANGDKSYIFTGEPYHLETLKEYLESFCYNVAISKSNYMSYGSGCCRAQTIIVTIPDELPCD